jgi:hypothetical protein
MPHTNKNVITANVLSARKVRLLLVQKHFCVPRTESKLIDLGLNVSAVYELKSQLKIN